MDNNYNDESTKRKKLQIAGKWFNFQVLSPTSAILNGNYAMTDKHFKYQSRGKQATACAVVAIILGNIHRPKTWTKTHVNKVLEYGDKVYRTSQTRNKIDSSIYMTTNMIYPEFFIEDYKCLISTESRNVYGNLFAESIGCPDFADGLQRFFRIHNCGVVTAHGTSVAMWYDTNYGYFYFDSAPCTESGLHSSDGSACIIRFKCLNDMQNFFLGNLSRSYDSRYCIDKVTILRITPIKRSMIFNQMSINNVNQSTPSVDKKTEKTMDCTEMLPKNGKSLIHATVINKEPLLITLSNYSIDKSFATMPLINQNGFGTGYQYKDIEVNIPSTFKPLLNDTAIIHGWTHESSEMYKGKGAQSVANCIMAIGMKVINNPRSWLRQTLDDVLILGDNLHAETKVMKPNLKTLTAADFNDTRVTIQGKRMFISVDLMTVVGTLNSKFPSVLNLKQAVGEFFALHKDGIIECFGMAMAIWEHNDYFYIFDPRECDLIGVRVIEEKKSSGKESKNAAASVVKKIKGKCCVMRFSNIDRLVTHFLGNINSARKNDRFTIRHISVMEDLPGLQRWYEFQPGEPGKTWILQGNLSNDAEEFEDETRGVQGLAIPVTALVNASEIPPHIWTRETVDDAIREGNEYFMWCIPLEKEEDRELTLERLKQILYVKNRRIKIKTQDSSVMGILEPPPGEQAMNLEQGIAEFFKTHQFGLLEVKNLAVAMWKFEEELKDKTKLMGYYYFDPSPGINLNSDAEVYEESGASVIRAIDSGELARLIATRVDPEADQGDDFFIHGFEVVSIGEILNPEELEREKQIPIKPELNAYIELDDDGAFINATFDQANEIVFKLGTRNKQQAANALVTLAMRQFYNPHLWYQEIVDDILKLGDKLTNVNVKNIEGAEDEEAEAPARNYLLPVEIEDTFDIGINRFTITIDEEKSRGMALDLTQLLEEYFNENSMGILRQDQVMLPIWKEGDVFFMMDPRARGNQNEPKDKSAAVFWFTTIASLASTIVQSLVNTGGELIIDGIELENDFQSRIMKHQPDNISDEHWYNFSKKRDGVWQLFGTSPIMDEMKFSEENRGKQSAAIAVVSAIFSKIYQPHQWTADIINEIVVTGDKLYEKSVSRLGDNSNLSVNEIITEFFLSNRRINIVISDCVEAGNISKQDEKIQNLEIGIDKFFEKYLCGILTLFNNIYIAIWKWKDNYYCLLANILSSEPYDKSSGNVSALRFAKSHLVSSYINEIFGTDGDYEISAIDIVDWNKLPPWKHDPSVAIRPTNLPPLNAFKRLQGGDARAILCASTHQGSKIFPWNIRNKQTAGNCIVALAMSVIKDPITWTRKTLDEILVVGSNVHEESIKFQEIKEKIKPSDIIRIFYIGTNVLTADVDQSTLIGQVAIPPPEPEVKGGKGKGKAKKKAPKAKKKKKGKHKREPPPPPPVIFLQEGLSQFFESNRAGVLVIGSFMIALWKDQGLNFLYDPRSRSDQGLIDDSGVACTMWFACIEPLYDLIFANLEGSEKYGQYSISRVVIKRNIIEGLPGPVGFQAFFNCTSPPVPAVVSAEKTITMDVQPKIEFNQVDDELSVLVGTISMYNQIFHSSTRGLQSTAMAAVAIVMGLLHVPSTWTPAIIDCILKSGDVLYGDSVRMAHSGARCLSPSELLSVFLVGDTKAEIRIHHHTAAGIMQIQDLTQALTLFFKNHCTGILHSPNLAVATMQHCGKFYMFDASMRNKNGKADDNGSACVIKCENIMRMAWIFVNNCNYKVASVYTLNAVDVLNLKFLSAAHSCPSPC